MVLEFHYKINWEYGGSNPRLYKHIANFVPHQCETTLNTSYLLHCFYFTPSKPLHKTLSLSLSLSNLSWFPKKSQENPFLYTSVFLCFGNPPLNQLKQNPQPFNLAKVRESEQNPVADFPGRWRIFPGKSDPQSVSGFSLLFPSQFPTTSSPRNFQGGVVGLGIVAAMTDLGSPNEVALSEKSPRSSPIPIVSAAKPAANFRGGFCVERAGAVVDELSESYTCVISHFGNNLTSKRVYFDEKLGGVVDDPSAGVVVASGVFSTSPLSIGELGREFWASDFLSCCYLCKKQLHELDIFMYRGEQPFCSAECRDKHMRSDDHKDECRSEALKSLDLSASPCSSPLVFLAGVEVA